MSDLSPELVQLANAYGVATEFWDWQGRPVPVPVATVTSILAALDVDASTPARIRSALTARWQEPWRRLLPAYVVMRGGWTPWVRVHVPHETWVELSVRLEDGGERRDVHQRDWLVEPQLVDGQLVGEATFEIPGDLPLGWHTLVARTEAGDGECPLIVTPGYLGLPPSVAHQRAWGFMAQLYSVRSERSWGLGDLADMAELAAWSGRDLHAGFLLVNPLHAAEPVAPMTPSPYLPTTRRFVNPIYVRVEDVPEVAYLPAAKRAEVRRHARAGGALDSTGGRLDRDRVWAAKRAALELVHAVPRAPRREADLSEFCAREGQGLIDFATWCALAERHGLPWQDWPAELRDPRSAAVESARKELADRVRFHCWLQWVLDEQLATVQRVARAAGMPLGVVHDLAVGVHPGGSDAWALQRVLAEGVSVGAPADAFNQQGQDWTQPPWRPDRLAEAGYAPYRDMLRTILRHAGGIRVDHVVGLFRLWWVPAGSSPAEGTYVRYDHEAMVGILALEAWRAGAVVVGEDLGTVEPWARDYLRERGLLGTSILWFERDGENRPLRPEQWRELCLATVTTHDLPPTAGYLAGEHIRIRSELGLLTRPVEEEQRVDAAERQSWAEMLTGLGLLRPGADERETVEALHRYLARTPARLLGVSLPDAVGERRAMNQPGTDREYPNWQLALADGSGRPVLFEDLVRSERARSLARAVSG